MLEAPMTLTDAEHEELRTTAPWNIAPKRPLRRSLDLVLTTVDEPPLFSSIGQRADLVRAYPGLDQVCDHLGFAWDQTLAERFPDPADVVLALARAAQPPTAPSHQDWSSYLVSELVSDLRDQHHRPMLAELQRLGILMDRALAAYPEWAVLTADQSLRTLRRIVNRHVRHDERVVFPLCIRIEDALHGRTMPTDTDVTSAIRVMADGHTAINRSLTRSIACTREACAACPDPDLRLIILGLEAMDASLAMHAYGELEILLPAAISAEEQLTARKGE
jgi:iron-sulfur cluster repair protein YtfE (RIC family)